MPSQSLGQVLKGSTFHQWGKFDDHPELHGWVGKIEIFLVREASWKLCCTQHCPAMSGAGILLLHRHGLQEAGRPKNMFSESWIINGLRHGTLAGKLWAWLVGHSPSCPSWDVVFEACATLQKCHCFWKGWSTNNGIRTMKTLHSSNPWCPS